MATCNYCKQTLREDTACTVTQFTGYPRPRLTWGNEPKDAIGGLFLGLLWTKSCPDCATPLGGYHHDSCDREQCSNCYGQLLGCDCDPNEPKALVDDILEFLQYQVKFQKGKFRIDHRNDWMSQFQLEAETMLRGGASLDDVATRLRLDMKADQILGTEAGCNVDAIERSLRILDEYAVHVLHVINTGELTDATRQAIRDVAARQHT